MKVSAINSTTTISKRKTNSEPNFGKLKLNYVKKSPPYHCYDDRRYYEKGLNTLLELTKLNGFKEFIQHADNKCYDIIVDTHSNHIWPLRITAAHQKYWNIGMTLYSRQWTNNDEENYLTSENLLHTFNEMADANLNKDHESCTSADLKLAEIEKWESNINNSIK